MPYSAVATPQAGKRSIGQQRRCCVPKLENDRRFKRYGVPINFLKLSDVTLLRNYSLEFIFELREEEEDAQEPQNFAH